jgi:hypothetical protein
MQNQSSDLLPHQVLADELLISLHKKYPFPHHPQQKLNRRQSNG